MAFWAVTILLVCVCVFFFCYYQSFSVTNICYSLRRVKMDQRKLNENQSTLVDMAKVRYHTTISTACTVIHYYWCPLFTILSIIYEVFLEVICMRCVQPWPVTRFLLLCCIFHISMLLVLYVIPAISLFFWNLFTDIQ